MTTPNMSCPSGGDFYACAEGSRFVGCCGRNPCGLTGCAAGDLNPTSFDPDQWAQFADQQCDAGQFWTCAANEPPFWGCCSTNPCGSGCAATVLSSAFLSNNANEAEPFLRLNDTVSTSSITTASSASSSTAASTRSSSSAHAGAIAGGLVGGIAVLALFIFGLLWLYRRRRREAAAHTQHPQTLAPMPEVAGSSGWIHKQETQPYASSSPLMSSSHHSSPALPQWSPRPPSYWGEPPRPVHIPQELPGSGIQTELDSGRAPSRNVK